MDRHISIVNASVAFHRALWKLRGATGKSTDEVLALRRVRKDYQRTFGELRKSLGVLRRAWPQCTELQCVDIATSITQAASVSLFHDLRNTDKTRPRFSNDTTVHRVMEAVIRWMMGVSRRTCDVQGMLRQIKDRPLTTAQAQKLRDQLTKDMPGILQWMDEKPPPV